MKTLLFLVVVTFLVPLIATVYAQQDTLIHPSDTLWIPFDTVYFDGYTGINYKVQDAREDNWWVHEWQIYLGDKKILTSFRWYPSPQLYDFCHDPEGVRKPCYIQDINGDSKGEIIFTVMSGGNDGRASTYIFSLDTAAVEIGRFEGLKTNLSDVYPADIDNDHIFELHSRDRNYECWPDGCAGSPAPKLIWKWDGKSYRLANFKLGHYILVNENKLDSTVLENLISEIKRDTAKIRNFNPSDEDH